jgi:hypothetical protein
MFNEKDLAVHLNLIANNNSGKFIIHPSTDPYTNLSSWNPAIAKKH